MSTRWEDLLHGPRWHRDTVLWVEDGREHTWADVDALARSLETVLRTHPPARVVRFRSASRLVCFAGQLAAWRAGAVAVADDGVLGEPELARIRPDLTVVADGPDDEPRVDRHLRDAPDLPPDVVAVNLTSGSTGRRKAVAVTSGNLRSLFDDPAWGSTAPVSGAFAGPTYDGWWFDTWTAVAAGGTVVCLPGVGEDVFEWPELAERYGIGRLLLPAAVLRTLVGSLPETLAGIGRIYSGGEEFRGSTVRAAREAGITAELVNLYGPTEATFATHMYVLPEPFTAPTVPIGRPLAGCRHELTPVTGDDGEAAEELVVRGSSVCLGYLDDGAVVEPFGGPGGGGTYRTGDLVALDDAGELVYRGRRDGRIKVNGMRVDSRELENEVLRLDGVADCRVVVHRTDVCAFVLAPSPEDLDHDGVDRVVRGFTSALPVRVVAEFPVRAGGKLDVAALMTSS